MICGSVSGKGRVVVGVAALGLAASTLLGCSSGPKVDGTYYLKGANGSDYRLGQLVIKDGKLTHHEYNCKGVYNEPDVTSTGEFNKERTQVIWTVAGKDKRNDRTGTETFSTSDTSVTIGGDIYLRDDTEAGKAVLAELEAYCAEHKNSY